MSVVLKGMTWNHPRGYDPMVACSQSWQEKTGVEIRWEKRSLQDFEAFPVETLARNYDLIIIDHPHVGQITGENCLLPLDVPGREAERQALSAASVGPSYRSYAWNERQWAFPIDAATQVQAWRPDRTDRPQTWGEMLALARRGGVLLPLRPPHSLMSFYTLCGNLGRPCRSAAKGDLVDAETGATAVELLQEISALIDPACFGMDPIAVLEAMAVEASPVPCAPLIYGYVSYSIAGFRPALVRFGDFPTVDAAGPVGSALGGTGIAVSAFSRAPGGGDRFRLLGGKRRRAARRLCGIRRPARPWGCLAGRQGQCGGPRFLPRDSGDARGRLAPATPRRLHDVPAGGLGPPERRAARQGEAEARG